MEIYGLLLDVDSSNLPVLLTATVRPPFETFRQFRSPSNRKKELNVCVFTSQHCQQLKSSGWSEVVVGQSTMQLTYCGTTRNFRKIRLQSSLLNCDYTLQVLQHVSTRCNQQLHCNDVCVCVSIIRTTRKYKRLHSRLTV